MDFYKKDPIFRDSWQLFFGNQSFPDNIRIFTRYFVRSYYRRDKELKTLYSFFRVNSVVLDINGFLEQVEFELQDYLSVFGRIHDEYQEDLNDNDSYDVFSTLIDIENCIEFLNDQKDRGRADLSDLSEFYNLNERSFKKESRFPEKIDTRKAIKSFKSISKLRQS